MIPAHPKQGSEVVRIDVCAVLARSERVVKPHGGRGWLPLARTAFCVLRHNICHVRNPPPQQHWTAQTKGALQGCGGSFILAFPAVEIYYQKNQKRQGGVTGGEERLERTVGPHTKGGEDTTLREARKRRRKHGRAGPHPITAKRRTRNSRLRRSGGLPWSDVLSHTLFFFYIFFLKHRQYNTNPPCMHIVVFFCGLLCASLCSTLSLSSLSAHRLTRWGLGYMLLDGGDVPLFSVWFAVSCTCHMQRVCTNVGFLHVCGCEATLVWRIALKGTTIRRQKKQGTDTFSLLQVGVGKTHISEDVMCATMGAVQVAPLSVQIVLNERSRPLCILYRLKKLLVAVFVYLWRGVWFE